jgi:hypothetical protein
VDEYVVSQKEVIKLSNSGIYGFTKILRSSAPGGIYEVTATLQSRGARGCPMPSCGFAGTLEDFSFGPRPPSCHFYGQ